MDLQHWIQQLGTAFRSQASRRRNSRSLSRLAASQIGEIDPLEPRILLTLDFGDAPDFSTGVAKNDYQTLASNNGPRHVIDGSANKLFLGAGVDGEPGNQQSLTAMLDDQFTGSGRDDEDGVLNSLDLINTLGAAPVVTLQATNLTGRSAKLSGWIDFDQNGVFDNAAERAQITVPDGTTNGLFTLTFPLAPGPVVGKTYARFRLSTDAAASNPIGVASDGEVEDYPFEIRNRVARPFELSRNAKITSGLNGGPTLAASDLYGISIAAIGDLDGNGITDLVIGAPGDDTAGTARGAVYVTLMNADGTAKSSTKIAHQVNGGPTLANGDYFGLRITSLGDLDGDGITDIAVGAFEEPNGTSSGRTGSVYIINLKSDGTAKHITEISSELNGGPVLANGDGFAMVESLGDLDGDGVVDLAVGAPDADGEKLDQGIVYILYLKSDGTVKRYTQMKHVGLQGTTVEDDEFGSFIANLGDLNHDGTVEIAVTGNTNEYMTRTGYVYMISLKSDGTYTFNSFLTSNWYVASPIASLGDMSGVTSIGDIDGDGVNDLALTMDSMRVGSVANGPGMILLATMKSDGTFKEYYRIAADTSGAPAFYNNSLNASSLRFLGDTNGDGSLELALGMPNDGGTATAKGSVYVLSLVKEDANTSIPEVPRIEQPAAVTTSTRPVIDWSDDRHAPQYEIWLRNDSTGVVLLNSVTVPESFYTPTQDLGIGKYSVWVRARNEKGYSAWSTRKGFAINAAVGYVGVPNGIGGRPTANWSAVPGATRYDIWIRNLSQPNKAAVQARTADATPSFTPAVDLTHGNYRIFARGIAADGTPGEWSQGFDFQVGITTVVTQVANQLSFHPTIRWQSVNGAAKYEIWVSEAQTPRVQEFGATTDSNLTSYTLSTDLPAGKYTVWIRALTVEGKAGAWSAGVAFAVADVPVLFDSKIEGAIGYPVTVRWDDVMGAASYEVKWYNPGTGNSAESTRIEAVFYGAWDWRKASTVIHEQGKTQVSVRAVLLDGSKGEWSLPAEVISRTRIYGVTQADAMRTLSQPAFSWTKDSTMVRYQLELRDLSRGSFIDVHGDNVTSNTFKIPTDLPIGDFELRVRGISADGIASFWSDACSFSYRPVAIPDEIANSPNPTPELSWSSVTSAVSYDVLVRDAQTGSTVLDSRNTAATSVTTGVLPPGIYRWWVVANGDGGVKAWWSVVSYFYISNPPIRLTSPVIFDVTHGEPVRLTWTTKPWATKYGLWIQAPNTSSPVFHQDYATTTNEFVVPVPLSPGTYRVWVRPVGSHDALGDWNEGESITLI